MKSSKVTNDVKKSSRISRASALDESPPRSQPRFSPARSPRVVKQNAGPKLTRRSPARKSPSRRSPGRKSPGGKSPSRKSPSRRSPVRKSPARKSPARTAKEVEEVPKSPSRRPAIKSESSKVVSESSGSSSSVKTESSTISRPRQFSTEYFRKGVQLELVDVMTSNNSAGSAREGLRERKTKRLEDAIIGSRRSSRLKDATDSFEKLLNLAQSTRLPDTDDLPENFSDNENPSEEESAPQRERSVTRTLVTPLRERSVPRGVVLEFGGWIGVLLQMIFVPVFVLGVNIASNGIEYDFTSWPNLQPFEKLDNWISFQSLLIYISFISLQVFLSLIPYFGERITLSGGKHTFNGLFCMFATLFIFMGVEYLDVPVFYIVHTQYFPLLVISILYGLLMGVALFIRGKKAPVEERNAYGNTGMLLYDFWMGREANPCLFGRFHVKLVFMRVALVGAVLINVVTLYHGIGVKNFPIISKETWLETETYALIFQSISISPTLLLFTSMQIFYFTHAIAQESKIVSTFEYQYEGTGLMLALGYSIFPFSTMSIPRYVLEHDVVLPNYALGIVAVVYLAGFYMYHASNTQKNAFRKDPLKFFYLDSLPTLQGKRLLISGWWGWVRHPNYLGDILIHLSWGAGALWAPPLLFIIATVLFLVHRAARDGRRCRERYGAAWGRYCRRVPYALVPKVY